MKTILKTTLSILLILVLLPLICTYLIQGKDKLIGDNKNSYEKILPGILAASMPEDFPKEAKKAQAVVLRTLLYNTGEKDGMKAMEKAKLSYQKVKEETVYDAVSETENEILYYDGKAAKPAFHFASAGKTRSVKEGENDIPYLSSVDSLSDKECEGYKAEKVIDGLNAEVLERDASLYVISVKENGKILTGEEFREKYCLNSSNFEIIQKKGKAIVISYGIGHGIGLSQYGAKKERKAGKNTMKY